MEKQKHKILKESLLFTFGSTAEAKRWMGTANDFQLKFILPSLHKILDQYVAPDNYVQLNKLEIELGTVTFSGFESRLEKELKQKLNKHPQLNPNAGKQAVNTENHFAHPQTKESYSRIQQPIPVFECFIYFLENSLLPWNSRFSSLKMMEKSLHPEISNWTSDQLATMRNLLKQTEVRKRIYFQFSRSLVQRLYATVIPLTADFNDFSKQIASLFLSDLNKNVLVKNSKLRTRMHILSTIGMVWSFKADRYYSAYLLNPFHAFLQYQISPLIPQPQQQLLTTLLNDKTLKKEAYSEKTKAFLFNTTLTKKTKNENHEDRINLDQDKPQTTKKLSAADSKLTAVNNPERVDASAVAEKKPQIKEQKIHIKKRAKKNQELEQATDQSKNTSTSAGTSAGSSASLPTSGQQPNTASKKLDDQQDSTPYYIDNAGLILLWPYLKTLFDKLGYLENKVFTTTGIYRAIHLLSFLAYGKQRKEEQLLLLPKILCGCLQKQAIPQNIRLNRKEKTEGLSLIEHAIANWSTLKNTSVAGFQSSFLQREGRLNHEDNDQQEEGNWKLVVKQESYDLLLAHLPYSIAMVKLSWMKNILKTDWA